MRALLIDAQAGIAGDMFVAAAAALADCEHAVQHIPEKLGLKDVSVRFSDVVRSTLQCRKCDVLAGDELADGHRASSPPRPFA